MSLINSIETIKKIIEEAIIKGGEKGKKSAITSSKTINVLHELVKEDLIKNGVNSLLIKPHLGKTSPEIKIAGFLKFKTQDVCVFPNNLKPIPEEIDFDGFHKGKKDPLGELFAEHILTINLRSQLSSLAKNKDTMFERTFAEPLNLHRRLPKMVLGEVYLLSARELDSEAVKIHKPKYKEITAKTAKDLEEYINGFTALNNRKTQGDDFFKYERVALVIADFSRTPVKIYETIEELKKDKLLSPTSNCSLHNLTYNGFIEDLLTAYDKRFGKGILT